MVLSLKERQPSRTKRESSRFKTGIEKKEGGVMDRPKRLKRLLPLLEDKVPKAKGDLMGH